MKCFRFRKLKLLCFLFIYFVLLLNNIDGYLTHDQFHSSKFSRKRFVHIKVAKLKIHTNSHSLSSSIEPFTNLKSLLHSTSKVFASFVLIPILLFNNNIAFADDELAKYAAEGNAVGVDGQCFINKCSIETAKCVNDRTCVKGLSCLSRCKGGSMCSTGCFAKYGSDRLDNLLYCSVEKNDCVQVPGKENIGWVVDKLDELPTKPLQDFDLKTLDGTWYKIMGLDSRYDCFDCQRNVFKYDIQDNSKSLDMEAIFRIPRPSFPGYLQSVIKEELIDATDSPPKSYVALKSQGRMFGLTFWENWYVLSDTTSISTPKQLFGIPSAFASNTLPEMKLIYYTGHTLQGSYKGAFVYSRSPIIDETALSTATEIIKYAKLNPLDFCMIKNGCFNKEYQTSKITKTDGFTKKEEADVSKDAPFWYLGQRFFQVTNNIAQELADWFEDPALVSDWLVNQQEHVLLNKPLVRYYLVA